MTDPQKQWLSEHPSHSRVKDSLISLTGWTDRGYLFPNGNFIADDGKTYFTGLRSAIYVGRQYQIV
jgi:hypothetical protein